MPPRRTPRRVTTEQTKPVATTLPWSTFNALSLPHHCLEPSCRRLFDIFQHAPTAAPRLVPPTHHGITVDTVDTHSNRRARGWIHGLRVPGLPTLYSLSIIIGTLADPNRPAVQIKERAWSFGGVSPVGFVSENGPAGSSSERTKPGWKIGLE